MDTNLKKNDAINNDNVDEGKDIGVENEKKIGEDDL